MVTLHINKNKKTMVKQLFKKLGTKIGTKKPVIKKVVLMITVAALLSQLAPGKIKPILYQIFK